MGRKLMVVVTVLSFFGTGIFAADPEILLNPGQNLTIRGTSGADAGLLFWTDANGRGIYVDNDDANKMKFYSGAGKGVGPTEVVIDNNGNLGIAQNSPRGKLDVVGGGPVSIMWLTNTNKAGSSLFIMGEEAAGGNTPFYIERWGSQAPSKNGLTSIMTGGPLVLGGKEMSFRVGTGSGLKDVLKLDNLTSSVHIPPGVKLTVGTGTSSSPASYLLTVNGGIKAKEIWVTLEGWADYVFAPGYDLRPLSEVEQHIRTHRHLPDVPSEAEVLSKPLGLGEMNKVLLRKVEELTLYVIALEKRIQALEAAAR